MDLSLAIFDKGFEDLCWHWFRLSNSTTASRTIIASGLISICAFCVASIGKNKPAYHATVYPTKYAHGFVVFCFVVVMQSFIMNSHEVFIHIHQGCFAGTGAIVRLPQCQWSKPDGYGKISPCITTTKHSKAKTVCIFLGIYCTSAERQCWPGQLSCMAELSLILIINLKICRNQNEERPCVYFLWMHSLLFTLIMNTLMHNAQKISNGIITLCINATELYVFVKLAEITLS